MKLYVASSWRNHDQGAVVAALREAGHEVYDFKHPAEGDDGFHWSEIDEEWTGWNKERFRELLAHPIAEHGFRNDWSAMQWAEAGVLILPCGRSAHLEAGYFVGAGKPLVILILGERNEPELMYKMADRICLSVGEVIAYLSAVAGGMTGADSYPNWSVAELELLSSRVHLSILTKQILAGAPN